MRLYLATLYTSGPNAIPVESEEVSRAMAGVIYVAMFVAIIWSAHNGARKAGKQ